MVYTAGIVAENHEDFRFFFRNNLYTLFGFQQFWESAITPLGCNSTSRHPKERNIFEHEHSNWAS